MLRVASSSKESIIAGSKVGILYYFRLYVIGVGSLRVKHLYFLELV